ncbi:MAG: hypothetical protein KDD78_08380, partial [Caldilineaceae bacterium]|nr:hypothetical protein [Caldilineaceae bacterium]
IARALVNNPSLLLADEPTGALDSKTGEDVMALFEELHGQGLTLVVVTHDMEVARQAERIITLKDGLIIDDVTNGSKLELAQREQLSISVASNGNGTSSERVAAADMAAEGEE